MHFYHYTSTYNFKAMHPRWNAPERDGLRPSRAVVVQSYPGLPTKMHEGASFGLIDPLDKAWCTRTFQPREPLLQTVLRDIRARDFDGRICLLKIKIEPEDDIYVADYASHLAPDYRGRNGKSEITGRVKLAYANSLVSFADYMKRDEAYAVPEVICFSRISYERLQLVGRYEYRSRYNAIRKIGGFDPLPPEYKPLRTPSSADFRTIDLG